MDWIIACTTLLSMELLAHKRWEGWAVGLANQVLWAWLIYSRELYGLIPLAVMLTWRYTVALLKWRRAAVAD